MEYLYVETKRGQEIILLILGIIGVIIIATTIWLVFFTKEPQNTTKLVINNTVIEIEILDTPEERSKGLSGREILLSNKGFWFVFEELGFYYFWMKDMNFPIDIIWIDENYKIIDITENLLPNTYPKSFTSKEKALFILEVSTGFVKKHNIKIGESFKIL